VPPTRTTFRHEAIVSSSMTQAGAGDDKQEPEIPLTRSSLARLGALTVLSAGFRAFRQRLRGSRSTTPSSSKEAVSAEWQAESDCLVDVRP
jgi:hypothetical protein